MLASLRIKNLAIIESEEIEFGPGLNIISGETGAGKSILIEAIGLILGDRASGELIRSGCDEAVVEGLFEMTTKEMATSLASRLERAGLPSGDELLIRRVLSRSGKHRIHINGALATLAILQDVTAGLVDICGQHEHQSLLKPTLQLELLDIASDARKDALELRALLQSAREKRERIEALQAESQERERKLDFLKFQIQEIQTAQVTAGEDEELQAKKKLVASSENRIKLSQSLADAIESEDDGLAAKVSGLLLKAKQLASLDDSAAPADLLRVLTESQALLEEAQSLLVRYQGAIEHDPGALEQIQDRLSELVDLKRKYGPSLEDVLSTLDRLAAELGSLEGEATSLGTLEQDLAALERKSLERGGALSKLRKKGASALSKKVTQELHELRMEKAKFNVELEAAADFRDWTLSGAEQVLFTLQSNEGEETKPLSKIASGGELSRIMLAIRRIISDRGGIGVYLFDEIDSGMGGQTAFVVGSKLKSVSKGHQVICITHLPQVASFADRHFTVTKESKSGRTVTRIQDLSEKTRHEELARMLGGPKLTAKSIENAKELLAAAAKEART